MKMITEKLWSKTGKLVDEREAEKANKYVTLNGVKYLLEYFDEDGKEIWANYKEICLK